MLHNLVTGGSMKPILFNTAMVQAILDGRKTVTRRVAKDLKTSKNEQKVHMKWEVPLHMYPDDRSLIGLRAPYQVGDVLWVRETWQTVDSCDSDEISCVYKASKNGRDWEENSEEWKWRPSIHMPKEAARIFMKVTGVRVERLQDMKTDDVVKEGVYNENELHYYGAAKTELAFDFWIDIWNSTIKKKDLDEFGWDANPWVWVIEFEVVSEREEK
jgi:hypothetical protein